MLINSLQVQPVSKQRAGHKPRIWVDYDYFCKAAKSISGENKRLLKHRAKHKLHKVSWTINSKNEIDILTVGDDDRVKYGILTDNEKLLSYIDVLKRHDAERKAPVLQRGAEELAHTVLCEMEIARANFPHYYNRLKIQHKLQASRCREFAERWAIWQWILENYSRSKNSLEIFHSAYCNIFPNQFSSANGKVSFKNFYNNCKANGIENTIVDKRAVVKVQNRRSEFQVAFLANLYIQNRKITRAEAHVKLVAACIDAGEKPMSSANVKIIFREFDNNIELYKERYGQQAAQKQMPFNTLLPAQHRNSQWQIDGWTLPFWGEKFQRYVLYLIRDNHSRKIVGYSVAETENTAMILEALEDAMRNTSVFPFEIVSDKHSFNKTQIAIRLKAETEKMGATWTVTTNAQRNQLAERYNQYLDTICKDLSGYLGKNITAKGKDAHLSPEGYEQARKSNNWKTVDEILAIAAYLVTTFNSSPLKPLNNFSPNDKYSASEDKHSFVITEPERVKLLRPSQQYKVIRGQITIKVGISKHEFQLPAELIANYNNQFVEVAYEDLAQGIYLFDVETGEAIGDISPKRKIYGAIADQTDEDKKLLNYFTGRTNGTVNRAKKEIEKLTEGLADNPEAIELVNSYAIPKEIRQEALKNAELQRSMVDRGINQNKLPIRKEQPINTVVAATTKPKESPFTPTNNQMRKLTMEDLLKMNEPND